MTITFHVLCVDDDPSFLDLSAAFLEREDQRIEVVTETNASDALERIESEGNSIDCIVSDYDMPGLDGVEFLETVRREHGELPFMLFTASGKIPGEAISTGVTGYFQKSGSEQYTPLADRIVDAVESYRNERTNKRAFAALNNVAVDLATCETITGICERSIEASQEILQFDFSVIDIEEDGYLSKMAISENVPEVHAITMSVEEGIVGKTFRTGESFLIDDLSTEPDAKPQGPYQSALSIPIGTHGVFQAVAEESNAFDETDLELAELLVSHTASALDRLEREQQLQRQNERLEKFARIVSHDLRNPLNVLEGYLESAREDCQSMYLENSLKVLSRMESIVGDTLTLVNEGNLVDEMESVYIETIAKNCWRNVTTESATLDVTMDKEIRADPDRLRHIFENLFRNAIEHGGSDVTVRVGGLKDGFYVEDDGEGISEGNGEKIFELGYTKSGGSGFGLTIVNQVADAHGWEVRVTDSTDSGARFEFFSVDSRTREIRT